MVAVSKIKSFVMKKIRILQAVTLVLVSTIIVSCTSGRQYQSYPPPPPPRPSVSLIINGGPGIAVHRYNNGRYYYRAPNGYIYWRGYNNRYYLDRRYIKPYYRHQQYNEWKRYHRRR